MKRSTIIFLLLLMSVAIIFGTYHLLTRWREYSFPDAGFAVTSPETISRGESQNVCDMKVQEYGAHADRNTSLGVAVSALDNEMLQKKPGEVLARLIPSTLADPSKSIKVISLQGNPGFAIEQEKGQLHTTERMFIANGRIYMVEIVTDTGHQWEGTTRFLDSFRLLPMSTAAAN